MIISGISCYWISGFQGLGFTGVQSGILSPKYSSHLKGQAGKRPQQMPRVEHTDRKIRIGKPEITMDLRQYAQQAFLKVMKKNRLRVQSYFLAIRRTEKFMYVNVLEFDLVDPFILNTDVEYFRTEFGTGKTRCGRNRLNDVYISGSTF